LRGRANLPLGGSISIFLAAVLGEQMETLDDFSRVATQGLSPESLKKLKHVRRRRTKVCDHDGLDEECPGPSCTCVCMNCLMGEEDDD